jgi:hypothetical protein
VSEAPEIGGSRIRTPGIDGEPVPVDAEVKVHDARAEAPDEDLDRSLRPPTLDDFVNQRQVTDQLTIFIEAAKRRGEPLDHVLLAGPPGLGKTSLAHIVAAELGVPMVQTAGPALERKADVAPSSPRWSPAASSSSTRSTVSVGRWRRRSTRRWRTASCRWCSARGRGRGR